MKTGKIIQVIGPVVDVQFDDYLPAINEAINTTIKVGDIKQKLVLEVASHIGDGRVRTIAMDMTEGLQRGVEAVALGAPISIPVGDAVLGRIINVLGEPIDNGEEIKGEDHWAIHRKAPTFIFNLAEQV